MIPIKHFFNLNPGLENEIFEWASSQTCIKVNVQVIIEVIEQEKTVPACLENNHN